MKQPAIYIMASKERGTLYTGVTSNLIKRIYEHKNKLVPGFTSKYECNLLVHYEIFDTMNTAINREKQLKGGSRAAKLALIEEKNPKWQDLYNEICRI